MTKAKTKKTKLKKVKKAIPRHYEKPDTWTYKNYIGTVPQIKKPDGKPFRISYDVRLHASVVELAKERDVRITDLYATMLNDYLKKSGLEPNGTIKILEQCAKQKKIPIQRLGYFALKDYLLAAGKSLPNNLKKS